LSLGEAGNKKPEGILEVRRTKNKGKREERTLPEDEPKGGKDATEEWVEDY